MKRDELVELVRKELYEALNLDEKSVPEPYNRKSPPRRKMTVTQINRRDRIGKKMMQDRERVRKFKKDHGKDWESYLWAAATSAAIKSGE